MGQSYGSGVLNLCIATRCVRKEGTVSTGLWAGGDHLQVQVVVGRGDEHRLA